MPESLVYGLIAIAISLVANAAVRLYVWREGPRRGDAETFLRGYDMGYEVATARAAREAEEDEEDDPDLEDDGHALMATGWEGGRPEEGGRPLMQNSWGADVPWHDRRDPGL